MFISGFTFVRNAVKMDYPVREAIRSMLPLCDEVIVMVGNSDDGTRELIEYIGDGKIKIFDSVWDDNLREGGSVLAVETDKAFAHISPRADWAIYIQADECLHEDGYAAIRNAMQKYKDDKNVEGLLVNYRHFYSSYDYIFDSRKWYRREVRIIKNDTSIHSYKDAQGFRKNGQKLKVKLTGGIMHHYGWVRHPRAQKQKELIMNKFWHNDQWMQENVDADAEFNYENREFDPLERFTGTHPRVMHERIKEHNWQFNYRPEMARFNLKDRILTYIGKKTGWYIGEYKNYKIV